MATAATAFDILAPPLAPHQRAVSFEFTVSIFQLRILIAINGKVFAVDASGANRTSLRLAGTSTNKIFDETVHPSK